MMTKHILILIFVTILLYYLSSRCSCINNGFRVGGRKIRKHKGQIKELKEQIKVLKKELHELRKKRKHKENNSSGPGEISSELCLNKSDFIKSDEFDNAIEMCKSINCVFDDKSELSCLCKSGNCPVGLKGPYCSEMWTQNDENVKILTKMYPDSFNKKNIDVESRWGDKIRACKMDPEYFEKVNCKKKCSASFCWNEFGDPVNASNKEECERGFARNDKNRNIWAPGKCCKWKVQGEKYENLGHLDGDVLCVSHKKECPKHNKWCKGGCNKDEVCCINNAGLSNPSDLFDKGPYCVLKENASTCPSSTKCLNIHMEDNITCNCSGINCICPPLNTILTK